MTHVAILMMQYDLKFCSTFVIVSMCAYVLCTRIIYALYTKNDFIL